MKLLCEKYKEEFERDDAVCRHPEDYCKFRSACIIHFLSLEKRSAAKKASGHDAHETSEKSEDHR